jgi:hypothetical protein
MATKNKTKTDNASNVDNADNADNLDKLADASNINGVDDMFCENCGNIYDIARSLPFATDKNALDNKLLDENTPAAVSTDDEGNAVDETNNAANNPVYEKVLKKMEEGNRPTNEELQAINVKDLVKNEYYKKMARKGEIKKLITDLIEELGNADDNITGRKYCLNCGNNKEIEPGLRILSKNPEGVASNYAIVNEASFRNKRHMRTCPRTRNYNCPNKNCPVYTAKKPNEAVFFRPNADSYQTIYVCVNCNHVKKN